MHKLLRDSKEVKMIRADSRDDNHTEVQISGDSRSIFREVMTIIQQVLKAFDAAGQEDLILLGIIDVIDNYRSSIINKNSKGEKKND